MIDWEAAGDAVRTEWTLTVPDGPPREMAPAESAHKPAWSAELPSDYYLG